MEEIKLICGMAEDHGCAADMIFTDPPFDMHGARFAKIIDQYSADHLVLIATMRQLLEFVAASDWCLAFDFVLDAVMPKKSKSRRQPNYTHQTCAYFTRHGARSRFDRKRRGRSDQYIDNGYWPTIFRAPRESVNVHGLAKNLQAVTDILGSFDVASVVDPFSGRGTVAIAASELGISATCIERDPEHVRHAADYLRFLEFSCEQLITVHGLEDKK